MERNYWLAIILSLVILMVYPILLRKIYPNAGHPKTQESAASQEAQPNIMQEVKSEASKTLSGVTPPSAPSIIQFENDIYEIKFSTLGASVTELLYKGENEKTHLARVPFFEAESANAGIFGMKFLNDETDLSQSIFKLTRKGASNELFEFVYEKPGAYRITKEFTIESKRPVLLLNTTIENLSDHERNFPVEMTYGLHYSDSLAPHHIDVEAVLYQEKIKSGKLAGILKKGFWVTGDMEWAGLVKKYFALIVRPDWKLISDENKADDQNIWATVRMEPLTVGPASRISKQVFIYAGPQRYETLKNLHMDFELLLSRGFFGLFKIWLLTALKFLYQFTHNYGWAIILLTVGLKVAFTPLTHMSYDSMRKMQAIQPKLKSIQERHKKDPTKMNREVMELYRRNKVNPMGGCLPMLAQIPIFIAFYQVLNETIELKGAPFIYWVHDLAEPDKLFHLPFTVPFLGDAFNLLPLFMIGSMIWQQKLTPQTASSSEQAKAMQFMPLMFGFLFYKMPSGLVLYWFINNSLTIIHQLFIKRMGAVVLHHEDRD